MHSLMVLQNKYNNLNYRNQTDLKCSFNSKCLPTCLALKWLLVSVVPSDVDVEVELLLKHLKETGEKDDKNEAIPFHSPHVGISYCPQYPRGPCASRRAASTRSTI